MTNTTAITTATTTRPVAATGPAHAVGLRQHALQAAHAYRAIDPEGFDRRPPDPAEWNRWARRARVARDIAAALDLPPGQVTVTDDPARCYRTRTGPVPGDLITVTDPATGRPWRFLPDITAPGQSWSLIDNCPDCDATVPVTRIATLADLGDYLDPDSDIWPADECHDDPAHRPGCSFLFGPAAG